MKISSIATLAGAALIAGAAYTTCTIADYRNNIAPGYNQLFDRFIRTAENGMRVEEREGNQEKKSLRMVRGDYEGRLDSLVVEKDAFLKANHAPRTKWIGSISGSGEASSHPVRAPWHWFKPTQGLERLNAAMQKWDDDLGRRVDTTYYAHEFEGASDASTLRDAGFQYAGRFGGKETFIYYPNTKFHDTRTIGELFSSVNNRSGHEYLALEETGGILHIVAPKDTRVLTDGEIEGKGALRDPVWVQVKVLPRYKYMTK